jgi:O-antigen chain-terminating methyltransferase
VQAFRGSEEEVRYRLQRYLELLRESAPVLDLGSGRGELLLMLREEGVEAVGIEGDPALVQAARRRGLQVSEGDVFEILRSKLDGSRRGITAFHILEHLPPAQLLSLLREAHRVLEPGGRLIIESPNPRSLRVAASLYWLDPTHQHPLHAETLRLYLRTTGFRVESLEYLHPFPEEQLFSEAVPEQEVPEALRPTHAKLDRLSRRLDDLLNGDRDFAIVAVKPQ